MDHMHAFLVHETFGSVLKFQVLVHAVLFCKFPSIRFPVASIISQFPFCNTICMVHHTFSVSLDELWQNAKI